MPNSAQLTPADFELKTYWETLGKRAKSASTSVSQLSSHDKNQALLHTIEALNHQRAHILTENQKDVQLAISQQLGDAFVDRLALDTHKIDAIITSLQSIISLPDPVGRMSDFCFRPSGIQVGKMRVPLGVIGMIYESRPNVTIEASALCFKSGNSCILRGGSESLHTNLALIQCIHDGLRQAQISTHAVQFVEKTDRQLVQLMIQSPEYVDVIVPRGGESLISAISGNSKIPVIKHLNGICHVFIDLEADMDKAVQIAINAKTRRYGTCNAMETLLLHEGIAKSILPTLSTLYQEKGVQLIGCSKTREIISAKPATEQDWITEYLDAILSIKIVSNIDEAIDHINQYGSAHSDAIVTENYTHTRRFMSRVDSSSVLINASPAFADGFEYGLGAEIGISTDKLHARGPVGLEGLTSQKYIVFGEGHIRP